MAAATIPSLSMSPIERRFCVLMEADECVRKPLLDAWRSESPEMLGDLERMVR